MSDKVSADLHSAEMNHGASSKVIVVLDRDEAEDVASCVDALDWSGDPVAPAVQGQAAIRAALDRDPDALIEQVAKALYGAGLSEWTQGGLNYATGPEWDRLADWQRHAYLNKAEAVLAAITGEGKD